VANLTTLRKQKKSNDFLLSPSPETKKSIKKINLVPCFSFLLIFLFLGKVNGIWKKITKIKDLFL
jgi:hypothetical protein